MKKNLLFILFTFLGLIAIAQTKYWTNAQPLKDGMGKIKNTLLQGEVMKKNQYLASSNGAFYCILQADGNLVIWRGNDPSLFLSNETWVWNLNNTDATTNLQLEWSSPGVLRKEDPTNKGRGYDVGARSNEVSYLILEDNGRLAAYKGLSPELARYTMPYWTSGQSDEVTSIDYSTFEYLDTVKIVSSVSKTKSNVIPVSNATRDPQVCTVTFMEQRSHVESTSATNGWALTLSRSSEGKADVDGVEVEATTTATINGHGDYTKGSEKQTSNQIIVQVPVSVDSFSKVMAILDYNTISTEQTYNCTGSITYASNEKRFINATGLISKKTLQSYSVSYINMK